ncbi:MAG: cytochrome P450 [Pseudomonadales bacterium]
MNIQDDAEQLAAARERAYSMPLEDFDVSDEDLFLDNVHWPYFERLRNEDPVHFCKDSAFGPYWSVTKFEDIKLVDTNHEIYSSEGSITIDEQEEDFEMPMFIAMDRPKHDEQRKAVTPVVAPRNLAKMEGTIRQRICDILDTLPLGETFNWVDRVSIELTTQMLATLFDFPFEDRRKLTRWSDVATGSPESGVVETEEQRREELTECLEYFTDLWNQRVNQEPGTDLISMMAHSESTKNMEPMEYLGNLVLLIVGGNDTTRNSISGGVLALNQFPDQYQKLRDQRELIPNMVAEIIRWQTPLAHMRRTTLRDTELGGKQIKQGDKVVMWYVSGNRDIDVFEQPDDFRIDRPNARQHVSFGYGIHRCMGNRLGEMQLRVMWEEIMKRFHTVEVVERPLRVRSNFVKGYRELPVQVHAW